MPATPPAEPTGHRRRYAHRPLQAVPDQPRPDTVEHLPLVHGDLSTYTNHGCRCDECKRANTEYNRARRAERQAALEAGLIEIEHGAASGYGNYGCRCEACTTAWARAARGQRQRRKENEA